MRHRILKKLQELWPRFFKNYDIAIKISLLSKIVFSNNLFLFFVEKGSVIDNQKKKNLYFELFLNIT